MTSTKPRFEKEAKGNSEMAYWKLVEAGSRMFKQSSEQRERQFSEPLRSSPMIGQFFDTTIVASSDKEWL